MPEEPTTITKTLTQEQIEEMKKEANSALHGDTMAYETSKYPFYLKSIFHSVI